MSILPVVVTVLLRICMCTMCVPQKSEEDIGFPKTGATNGCEPPCGFLELNPDPLQGQ